MVEIKLKDEIKINGTAVKSLSMRQPRVSDQLAASDSSRSAAHQEINLLANLCEVSPDDISSMTLRDYRQLQKVFESFLE